MIYDNIAHAALYQGLGSRFAQAFEYLSRFDATTADGKVSLDGDNLRLM